MNKKSTIVRTTMFTVLWIVSLYLYMLFRSQGDDLASEFLIFGLFQLPPFVLIYFFLDQKYAAHSFFIGREWIMPVVFLGIAAICFYPLLIAPFAAFHFFKHIF